MPKDIARLRKLRLTTIAWLMPVVASCPAWAGDHRGYTLVPVYPQQAPIGYTVPTTYAGQAPLVYAASAGTVYSAPGPTQYSTTANQAPAGVGNAPGMVVGIRIKVVDREDIVEELRKAYKDMSSDDSRRTRRKNLTDSAKAKYAEQIGGDAEGLNTSELQDIDNIVNAIMDPSQAQDAAPNTPFWNGTSTGNAPTPGSYVPTFIPGSYAPANRQIQYVQPVVPVQVWVPVKPKHHWFQR